MPAADQVHTSTNPHPIGDPECQYVFAVAMKIMRDEEAAADVAQDALLQAYKHRNTFGGRCRYTTWLYRITTTTALMHMRKRRRRWREVLRSREDAPVPGEDRPSVGPSPEFRAANTELIKEVTIHLDKLGPNYKQIFWMRYFLGYTEPEIAKELHLTLPTVKTRAHRARRAIREGLASLDA